MPALRRRVTAPRPRRTPVVELTCAEDGLTHRIDETTYAAALTTCRGRYRATCGHLVLPAAMTTPPGHRCPACDRRLS